MRVSKAAALALTALALILAQTNSGLAEYPERPIRLLLPFPAGGAVDIVARVMAAQMANDLGKPILIENKSGAGGIVATDAVAKSAPDGYTILLTTPNHTINAALQQATSVPLGVAERAAEVQKIAASLKPITNPNMSSDLTTAGALARAALEGALANVEINLASLKPETPEEQAFAQRTRGQVAALKAEGQADPYPGR